MQYINEFLGYDKHMMCKQRLSCDNKPILIAHPRNILAVVKEFMLDADMYFEKDGIKNTANITGLELKKLERD